MQELGSGQLTPNQAEQIFSLIENRRQLLWIQKAEEQERARELERQRRFNPPLSELLEHSELVKNRMQAT